MTMLTSIVRSVASSVGCAPLDLPPLYETIDPEIVANFVDSVSDDSAALAFPYCGHRVIIQGNGDLIVNHKYPENIYN